MNLSAFAQLFVLGFLLNMVWEVWHSQLYTTCLRQTWTKNIRLLTVMSLKDAFFIVIFYILAFALVEHHLQKTILHSVPYSTHLVFAIIAMTFAFVDERFAIAQKRWEYAPSMPLFFGVGITPLFEIAITGVIAYFMVSL